MSTDDTSEQAQMAEQLKTTLENIEGLRRMFSAGPQGPANERTKRAALRVIEGGQNG